MEGIQKEEEEEVKGCNKSSSSSCSSLFENEGYRIRYPLSVEELIVKREG